MWVVYGKSLFQADLAIREALFPWLKSSNPELKVDIKDSQGAVKTVAIKDLEDYSIYRNRLTK